MKKMLLTGLFVSAAGVVSCMDMVSKVVNTDNALAVARAGGAYTVSTVAMERFTAPAPKESSRLRQGADQALYWGAVGGSTVAAACPCEKVQTAGTLTALACGITRRVWNGAHQAAGKVKLPSNVLMVNEKGHPQRADGEAALQNFARLQQAQQQCPGSSNASGMPATVTQLVDGHNNQVNVNQLSAE